MCPKVSVNCFKTFILPDKRAQVWKGGRGQTRFSQKPNFVGFFKPSLPIKDPKFKRNVVISKGYAKSLQTENLTSEVKLS